MATYKVFDQSHKLIVSGTAQECGEILGLSGKTIVAYARACRSGEPCKYKVITSEPPVLSGSDAAAIKAWDDFCEPIRKKYGIPVRHLGEGKK